MRESYSIRVYKQYFNFGSAHFLIFGDGSREELHGHNYKVEVRVWGDTIAGDLVLDFIQFKPVVKAICDELDHVTLLPANNPHLELVVDEEKVEARHRDGSFFAFPRRDVRIIPIPNTSVEMLARHIVHTLVERLPASFPQAAVQAIEVEVEESPGQSGICRLDF